MPDKCDKLSSNRDKTKGSNVNLKNDFPRIMAGLKEEIDEVRHLLVIDENYDDVDSDEFDVFDPSEFNYMIYVTEALQEVLGEEGLAKAISKLQSSDDYKDFYAHENDMYGVMTTLDDEGIAKSMLTIMEETLS